MVDRIRYPTVSYLPFYYVFFQFLLLTIFNLQANILTTKDILSNLDLGKYFMHLLSHLTVNQYSVKNSCSFVKDIKKITSADTLFMCSFDIENLYTNVPLQDNINIYRSVN